MEWQVGAAIPGDDVLSQTKLFHIEGRKKLKFEHHLWGKYLRDHWTINYTKIVEASMNNINKLFLLPTSRILNLRKESFIKGWTLLMHFKFYLYVYEKENQSQTNKIVLCPSNWSWKRVFVFCLHFSRANNQVYWH